MLNIHRTCRIRESIIINSQLMQHAQIQVAEKMGVLCLSVGRYVLAVLEAAASYDRRQVLVAVNAGVAHARTKEDDGAFEQRPSLGVCLCF